MTADSARAEQGSGAARGTSSTTLDVTAGGGTKLWRGTSNRMRVAQRQLASTARRP